jgi:hypothetical protein
MTTPVGHPKGPLPEPPLTAEQKQKAANLVKAYNNTKDEVIRNAMRGISEILSTSVTAPKSVRAIHKKALEGYQF